MAAAAAESSGEKIRRGKEDRRGKVVRVGDFKVFVMAILAVKGNKRMGVEDAEADAN